MNKTCLRLIDCAATLFVALSFSLGAHAQNPPPTATDQQAGEIVTLSPFEVSTTRDQGYRASNSVSGSRMDTPIKDLPFALQAFTEQFINDQRPTNIIDIAIYSPNVTFRSNDFTEGNANLAIRGFAVSSAGIASVLRDGFRGSPVFDATNIVRMEIVKGPASFLYGQLAPGGMVNIITKSPKEKFEATLDASYGSYGEYRGALDVTGPLTNEFLYRLNYSYSHDINYWKPYDSHQIDFAPQFLWKLNDQATLTVKFEKFQKNESPEVYQKAGFGAQNGIVATATDPNWDGVDAPGLPDTWNTMADNDYRNSKDTAVTVALDIKAGEHWNVRTGYAFDKNDVDAVFSGNLGIGSKATADALGAVLQGRRWRFQEYKIISNSAEAQAIGKYQFGDTSLKLLLGAQYNPYSFVTMNGSMPNNPAANPAGWPASPLPDWNLGVPSTWNRAVPSTFTKNATVGQTNTITRSTDSAYYAGLTTGFFKDRLLLLAGVRLTTSVSQTTNRLPVSTLATGNPPNTIAAGVNPVGQEFSTSKNTPQFGALYKITPEVSAFASFSKSFVPNATVLRAVDKTSLAPQWVQTVVGPAAPTLGQGYDLGLKTDLLSGRVSGTITYYNVEQTNIVNDLAEFNFATGTQFFTSIQAGKQRSKGVEIDATLAPTDNWQIYFSASFADHKILYLFTESEDARLLAAVGNISSLSSSDQTNLKNVLLRHGLPLQMSAPRQYNLWTRYDFTGDLKGLHIAGGANYVGDQTILPDSPAFSNQTYTLWNGLIGYSTKVFGNPTVFDLNGKNLGNEHYRPSQSSRGRPREIIFTVSTKF